MALISRTGILLTILAALGAPANAQQSADDVTPAGGPFVREPMLHAPFAADATTRVHELLPNGTARDSTVTARYYRDSRGRVRAEVDAPSGPFVMLDTAERFPRRPDIDARPAFYVLDPVKRNYRSA